MTKIPLIIDCDPGQDDAIMLMMAFSQRDRLDILGVVTVGGNVALEKTARNARIICELTGHTDIDVYAGCAAPLVRGLETAAQVHGPEGMNGAKIYEPKMPLQKQHGADFIIERLRAAREREVVMVITGPSTNLAWAITKAPEIKCKIKEIVLMGGGMKIGGNVTPSAEYNIYADPHAADILYKSGVKIVTIGLDVTHQVLASKNRTKRIKSIGNKVADTAYNILGPHSFYDANKYGWDGGPLHDPCTIAYVLDPTLFTTRFCNLAVETNSKLTLGHTSIDFWGAMDGKDRPKNTHWAYGVNDDGIYDLLFTCLEKYS